MQALYLRYARRVRALTARIVGAGDAEELTQEVFIKVFRCIGSFRGESQLGTWIYRLAVNTALTHATRSQGRKRKEAREEVLAHIPAAQVEGDPLLQARLERALLALPAGYRAVLVLHDIEGLQHEEIAQILDVQVGTSKSQLHKARARMRELLNMPEGETR
jgi:RNA polymerase sigma-70 factor (ECF subfamily)